MTNVQEKTIIKTIIDLSDKLHGCKLEDSVLAEEKQNLEIMAKYLNVDELSALFFTIIFYHQSQAASAVSLSEIADFLDYPHLNILMYSKNFAILEKKYLIDKTGGEQRMGRHSGSNSGYEIPSSVFDCIVENSPLIQMEDSEDSSDKTFKSFYMLFKNCLRNNGADENFFRTISTYEHKFANNEIVKNITNLFPENVETRIILYILSSFCIAGKSLCDDESDFIFDMLATFIKYQRCRKLNEEKDILYDKKFIVKCFEEVNIEFGRRPSFQTIIKLSPEGIRQLFGSEADRYVDPEDEKSDIEKTVDALHDFGNTYEKKIINYRKKSMLVDIEMKYQHIPFFKKIKSTKFSDTERFFLYDCAKDFVDGNESALTTTLSDIYGKSNNYFKILRTMLDEKDNLSKGGYIEIEKHEVLERTTVTLSDKSIELLYGKNADLYIKKPACSRNIIEPAKIKAKELFYSKEVQKQIDMLEESLSQKNLNAMQKRLEAKGLSKGVAVLLYGAPGTGKTETVYQMAKKTNRKILHVDISESKSMWFGESEKIIKRIFTNYRQLCQAAERHHENTPILLFNEADALISKRRDVTSGNCAQTENAIQNILLEEIEKLDGIIFATTNLCNNMDKAFERRFLFKIEYEKPSLEARKKIWSSKLPDINEQDIEKLAERFDFSGGEIDNIARKCEISEIIKGKLPDYSEIADLCENERLEKSDAHHVGFCVY